MATHFPGAMREIRLPQVPGTLNMLYNPGILPHYQSREHLMNGPNAHKVKILHKLTKRSKDKLYWSFIPETSRNKLPLSTMRNRYQRRWNAAFVTALKNNGYDYHGQKLLANAGASDKPKPGLRGTLEIKLMQAVHWEDKDLSKMIEHSDRIVKGLKKLDMSTSEVGTRSFKRDVVWRKPGR